MIKYVLWDFNGTIVNDVDISVSTMNELLARRKMEALSIERYKDLFTFPVIDYYKRVGIIKTEDEFSVVANEWMEDYYAKEHQVEVHQGIIEVMQKFCKLGIKQGVLSASRQDQLERMLADTGLVSYFDDILGISDIYAASKAHVGEAFIQRSSLDKKEVLMIGDTVHDMEVANMMGVHCVLCANGHQSMAILAKHHDLVINSIDQIFDLAILK